MDLSIPLRDSSSPPWLTTPLTPAWRWQTARSCGHNATWHRPLRTPQPSSRSCSLRARSRGGCEDGPTDANTYTSPRRQRAIRTRRVRAESKKKHVSRTSTFAEQCEGNRENERRHVRSRSRHVLRGNPQYMPLKNRAWRSSTRARAQRVALPAINAAPVAGALAASASIAAVWAPGHRYGLCPSAA